MPPSDEGTFRFEYLHPLPSDFHPFLAFPDAGRAYESPRLFPFFQNRIMSADRPDYDDYLTALGLTRLEATPFEILSRTAGERSTDAVQVVPYAQQRDDGRVTQLFLASGVRHFASRGVETTLSGLASGDILTLADEPENDWDPRALLLNTANKEPVGYMPSYLLDLIHKLRNERPLQVTVVRVNGPSVAWHLRLLCELQAEPTKQAAGPSERAVG